MKLKKIEYVPTLNEFVETHKDSTEIAVKRIVDDFLEFPDSEDEQCETRIELIRRTSELRQTVISRIDDVIMCNRYALAQYNYNAEVLEPILIECDRQYHGMLSQMIESEHEDQHPHARLIRPFDTYCEIKNAKTIANEGMIIHLWATIEQHVKQVILLKDKKQKSLPHQWEEIVIRARRAGIHLKRLPSYKIIDEIRIVNNKIKHLYIVDNTLCKYDGFAQHKGKKMSAVDYRIHEYAIGAHHFMNRVICSMGPTVRY
jgi:hypothetical protein